MYKKVILHLPHSSTNIPSLEGFVVPKKVLEDEQLLLTDWYTDELFQSANADRIVADFSRIFCDPERFTDDAQEVMSQFGMGVLYTKNDAGTIIRKLNPALREEILTHYYWKHHTHFNQTVKQHLKCYGTALIIDCHSFPDKPLKRDLCKKPNRPDFNIGIDKFHTPQKLIETSINFFNRLGFSLGIDEPYSGTIVPSDYYQKNSDVHSIMLEINRKLYLQEGTNKKSENFGAIQKITNEFIEALRKA